jgi:hypothetical protein
MQLAAAQAAIPLVQQIVGLQALIANLTIIQGDGSFISDSPTIDSPTPSIGPGYHPTVPALTAAESAPLFAAYMSILQTRLTAAENALAAL